MGHSSGKLTTSFFLCEITRTFDCRTKENGLWLQSRNWNWNVPESDKSSREEAAWTQQVHQWSKSSCWVCDTRSGSVYRPEAGTISDWTSETGPIRPGADGDLVKVLVFGFIFKEQLCGEVSRTLWRLEDQLWWTQKLWWTVLGEQFLWPVVFVMQLSLSLFSVSVWSGPEALCCLFRTDSVDVAS